MVHGLGAGTALFSLNFEGLSKYSTIYAIDLPGFSRSSRNKFSTDPTKTEAQFVETLERWRSAVNINVMNLMGHSFGGYLVTSYSLKYPDRVRHLVLADPWGFAEMPPREELEERFRGSWFFKIVFSILIHFNPLMMLRLTGRLGCRALRRLRSDLTNNYVSLFEKDEDNIAIDYIIHSNLHEPT